MFVVTLDSRGCHGNACLWQIFGEMQEEEEEETLALRRRRAITSSHGGLACWGGFVAPGASGLHDDGNFAAARL